MKNLFLALFSFFAFTLNAQTKILFDAAHGESAANADWVMDADLHNMGWGSTGGYTCTCASNESNAQRLPTPTQTAVISSTAETYWDGALSNWAVDCVKKGYWVETLPFGFALTYGNTSNAQDLSNYDIFVVDEPNVLFTSSEKTALMNFMQNGGSLFMISDHDGSDRNGDGYDSPAIWNDLISNNGVSNNSMGFNFSLQNFSGTHTNVITAPTDSLLHGPYGNVTKVQWAGGTCMKIFTSQNPSVKAVVYKNGTGQADSAALVVHARIGCGKVAVIADSSPVDDGTGDPNDNSLYNGYILDAAGNHQKLLMNAMVWLAQKDCNAGINTTIVKEEVTIYPNPSTGKVFFKVPQNAQISVYNLAGEELKVNFTNDSTPVLNSELPAGMYYCRISKEGYSVTKMLAIIPH